MEPSNNLILGSGSPRRKELLENAGFRFEVHTIDVDESYPIDLPADQVAEFLAKKKNKVYRDQLNKEIVLTADTLVILDKMILGKPSNKVEAIETLKKLSKKEHKVVTGVCISSHQKEASFSVTTVVKFKELSTNEIQYYVERFSPLDKAGSYAIQEWIGQIGIEWIRGSFYNVVGLPLNEVYSCLNEEFPEVSISL